VVRLRRDIAVAARSGATTGKARHPGREHSSVDKNAGGAADRITWCRDHLATLLLLADPLLTDQLREHLDAAFAGLTPKQRDRMATTLVAWLQTRGTHNELAARLDVHPQTVRYRIHQLQQLLGDRLTDPDARLTMELALRAHMLLAPPNPRRQRWSP
jgi:DNA-binding PucR family transcriptional regulator